MMEEFKKIFLLGIGAASMTYEKSMEIINDMVKGKAYFRGRKADRWWIEEKYEG